MMSFECVLSLFADSHPQFLYKGAGRIMIPAQYAQRRGLTAWSTVGGQPRLLLPIAAVGSRTHTMGAPIVVAPYWRDNRQRSLGGTTPKLIPVISSGNPYGTWLTPQPQQQPQQMPQYIPQSNN